MGDSWLQQKCSTCSEMVAYLPQWVVRPKYCNRCRLLKIDGLKELLEWFLEHENKLKKQIKAFDEKLIFAEREPLRKKIAQILRTPNQLTEACIKDESVSRLVFQLVKERNLSQRKSRGSKKIIPKNVGKFFQGGAPGLGKRS